MSDSLHTGIKFAEALKPTNVQIGAQLRQRASEFLSGAHLPTSRDEAWKYTRLSKLNKISFVQDENTSLKENFSVCENACQIIFVNGTLATDLASLNIPKGIQISRIRDLKDGAIESKVAPEELFNAVNISYLSDCIQILVEKGEQVEQPIEILHVLKGKNVISNFKTIIKAEDFSKATIIQGFFTESEAESCFVNNSLESEIGINANITIDKIQYENGSTFHISNDLIDQQKDSTISINTHTLNGGLVRNNLTVNVLGKNCTSNLYGTYLLNKSQHVDNHTVVDHKVAHCNSNELYKGVMNDKSTGVFNGKVYVRQDAQKINAFQSNANILLSDDASVNSKPELEIYADDVKCSHGSTTGQLDEEAVFYLQTRGISKESARNLLIIAFVEEVIEKIENDEVRGFIENCLNERFNWAN